MDKRWMNLPRYTSEYENGVDSFLDFAFQNASNNNMILCPCVRCVNGVIRTRDEVKEHVIVDGFIKGYTSWIAHGELALSTSSSSNDISNINKEIQREKTMPHRTEKRSCAQIYDNMSKDKNMVQPASPVQMKACYLDKNKNARSGDVANAVEIGPDNVFAQVIGKDRNKRVRMIGGGGVAPSDLWDNFPSRGSNYRMAMEYKSALERSKERYSKPLEMKKKLTAELADIRAMQNQQRSTPSVNTSAVRSASSD